MKGRKLSQELTLAIKLAGETPSLEQSGTNEFLLYTLLFSGLRVQELLLLRFEDVDFETNTLRCRTLKGSNPRVIPMDARVVKRLQKILEEDRSLELYRIVFKSKSAINASRTLRFFFERFQAALTGSAECRHMHKLHDLRHTYAMRAFELLKFDIVKTQTLMGHKAITSTAVYLNELSKDEVANTVRGKLF